MDSVSLSISTAFVAYVESLLVRLGYLYPDVEWSFDPDARKLKALYKSGTYSADRLTKEAFFHLYRERIYHETLDVRRNIYEAI